MPNNNIKYNNPPDGPDEIRNENIDNKLEIVEETGVQNKVEIVEETGVQKIDQHVQVDSVEAFNKFLADEFGVKDPNGGLTKETITKIQYLNRRYTLWANVAKFSGKYIKSQFNRFHIPYKAVAVFSLPVVGFFITSRNDPTFHHLFDHRLPTLLPGSSLLTQNARPSTMRWDTVGNTQFFHQIDWNDVEVANYQNDSTFVIFKPNMRLKMQGHYLGAFETPQQIEDNQYNLIGYQNDVKGMNNTSKPSTKLKKKNKSALRHFIRTSRLAKRTFLNVIRVKVKHTRNEMEFYYHRRQSFKMDKQITRMNDGKCKKVNYPFKKNWVKHRMKMAHAKKLSLKKVNWYFKKEINSYPAPVEEKSIVTAKNYHILFNGQTINDLNSILQKKWFTKHHTKTRFKKADADFYWQTYFHALDLIPLKIESITFTNEVQKPLQERGKETKPKEQIYKEYTLIESNKQKHDREEIKRVIKKMDLSKKYVKNLNEYFERQKRNDKIYTEVFPADPTTQEIPIVSYTTDSVMFTEVDGLMKENVVENKRILNKQTQLFYPDEVISPVNNRNTFIKDQKLNSTKLRTRKRRLYSQYNNEYPRYPAKLRKKHQKERFDRIESQQYRQTVQDYSLMDPSATIISVDKDHAIEVPPLFDGVYYKGIKIDEMMPLKDLPKQNPNTTKNLYLEPKTKIDLLTHKIQSQLNKSLTTNMAFRQTARYQLYNSLFGFKTSLGARLNRLRTDPFTRKPITIKPHNILKIKPTLFFDKKYVMPDITDSFFYEMLVDDSDYFQPNYAKKRNVLSSEVEPNLNRFDFNRRARVFDRRLMFNDYAVLPITQKNLFNKINLKLKELNCYKEYRSFYDRFLFSSLNFSNPAFMLEDILDENDISASLEKDQLEKNEVWDNLNKKLPGHFKENNLDDHLQKNLVTYLNSQVDFEPELKAVLDNPTHFSSKSKQIRNKMEVDFGFPKTNIKHDKNSLNFLNRKLPARQNKLSQKIENNTRYEAQLHQNKKLIKKYKLQMQQQGLGPIKFAKKRQETHLKKTKLEIRNRVIQGHSPFLQRQLSGYLNPDASFRDKYIELLGWDNLFEQAKVVKAFNKKFGFKLNYSKNSISKSIFQLTAPLPMQNAVYFQRLINPQNERAFDFRVLGLMKNLDPNEFQRPYKRNFYGKTYSTFGIPLKPAPGLKMKHYEDDKAEFYIDWEKFNDYITDENEQILSHHPFSVNGPDKEITEIELYERYAKDHYPAPYVGGLIKPENLLNKSFNRLNAPDADIKIYANRLVKPDFDKWIPIGARYSGLEEHCSEGNMYTQAFKYKLKVPLTSAQYLSFLIFCYYVSRGMKRFKIDYWRSISIGIQDFLNKLDTQTIKKVFEVNQAVVRCDDITFTNVVGGKQLLNLFYPTILSSRAQVFSFRALPILSYSLLNQLTCSSVKLVDDPTKFEIEVPGLTEKERQRQEVIDIIKFKNRERKQQGYLLIGPPGTGKTFLVKALAGECNMPVIIPSKYTLAVQNQSAVEAPLQNSDDVLKLRQLFDLAKTNYPCILFLDEVDSLGPDRRDVQAEQEQAGVIDVTIGYKPSTLVKNKAFDSWRRDPFINEELLDLDKSSRDHYNIYDPGQTAIDYLRNKPAISNEIVGIEGPDLSEKIPKPILSRSSLANLTQLLCSLDGINSNEVLVIGATNRPHALDPALIRPGRLNKIIYLDLPKKQKRLQLLKFYSGSKVTEDLDWDYFSKLTTGLSPAHVKAAVNLSALQQAYNIIKSEEKYGEAKEIKHDSNSIEYGILSVKDPNAFYKGFFKRCSKKIEKIVLPPFFESVFRLSEWQHVSLATLEKPIELKRIDLSTITLTEIPPSINETTVWNGMPEQVKRVSFPQLYENIDRFLLRGVGSESKTRMIYWENKGRLTREEKLKKRYEFYKKHRKKLRLAYLLTDPKKINYEFLPNKKIEDHPFVNGFSNTSLLSNESAQTLELGMKFMKRLYKPNLFGAKLLLNTPLFINNPFAFQTEFIYEKRNDLLVRSKTQFVRFSSHVPMMVKLLTDENPTFFLTEEEADNKFHQIFSNHLALHRSLAYNASKAIMVHLLTDTYEQEHVYDMWNRFRYDYDPEKYKRRFLKAVKENFNTRKDFENYLLALSAGKIGEHLMLFYREQLPTLDPLKPRQGRYSYDISEIGKEELKQMKWLLNIMVEKCLFYDPNVDVVKQVLTAENEDRSASRHDLSVGAIASNYERWDEFDKRISRLYEMFDENIVKKYLHKLRLPPAYMHWWEPSGVEAPLSSKYNSIREWRKLFVRMETVKLQKWPEDCGYDRYKSNYLKTRTFLETPFNDKDLPAEFVELVKKDRHTWNQECLSLGSRISRALLLDTFAKSAHVLSGQRELHDHLSYYLLRYGRISANQIKQMSHTFLEEWEKEAITRVKFEKEQLNKKESVNESSNESSNESFDV